MEGGARDPPPAAAVVEMRRWVAGPAAGSVATAVFFMVAVTQLLVFFFLGDRTADSAMSLVWRQQQQEVKGEQIPGNSASTAAPDRLLRGLLTSDFDDEPSACLSRYEASKRWKPSPFPVSPHLVERLRRYEANHRRCGPGTAPYRAAVAQLQSGRNARGDQQCRYVVWLPTQGLGNRMLSLVSTFLYGLLTVRVLLVHEPPEMEGLFCEPFPGTSWLLPAADFPRNLDDAAAFSSGSRESYVSMLENNVVSYVYDDAVARPAPPLPAYVYLHLEGIWLKSSLQMKQTMIRLPNHTFCDEDHRVIDRFNWTVVRSDNYFAVALFLMPMYRAELDRMFPAKGSVFHHLGRYLLHPGNRVWGMVERFFDGYLAGADERVGVQVRVKPRYQTPFEVMYEQIIRCAREHRLLPQVLPTSEPPAKAKKTRKKKKKKKKKKAVAVLVVSLKPEYYERLHGTYYSNATTGGVSDEEDDDDVVVTVHQPSHDGDQRSEARAHNERALAEIYLLSFCDRVVTTGWSTFGYAAHALAGMRPWLLMPLDLSKMRADVACVRPTSVEPCLHAPPSSLVCLRRRAGEGRDEVDPAEHLPFLRHCEDVPFGIKLFD